MYSAILGVIFVFHSNLRRLLERGVHTGVRVGVHHVALYPHHGSDNHKLSCCAMQMWRCMVLHTHSTGLEAAAGRGAAPGMVAQQPTRVQIHLQKRMTSQT